MNLQLASELYKEKCIDSNVNCHKDASLSVIKMCHKGTDSLSVIKMRHTNSLSTLTCAQTVETIQGKMYVLYYLTYITSSQ
jgi:hypothetical protein